MNEFRLILFVSKSSALILVVASGFIPLLCLILCALLTFSGLTIVFLCLYLILREYLCLTIFVILSSIVKIDLYLCNPRSMLFSKKINPVGTSCVPVCYYCKTEDAIKSRLRNK